MLPQKRALSSGLEYILILIYYKICGENNLPFVKNLKLVKNLMEELKFEISMIVQFDSKKIFSVIQFLKQFDLHSVVSE